MCSSHVVDPHLLYCTCAQVFRSIPYCVDLLGGPHIETHAAVVDAFRPAAERRKA